MHAPSPRNKARQLKIWEFRIFSARKTFILFFSTSEGDWLWHEIPIPNPPPPPHLLLPAASHKSLFEKVPQKVSAAPHCITTTAEKNHKKKIFLDRKVGLGSRLFFFFFGVWGVGCCVVFFYGKRRVLVVAPLKKLSSFLLRWWMSIYHLKGREGGTKQAAGDEANETKGIVIP